MQDLQMFGLKLKKVRVIFSPLNFRDPNGGRGGGGFVNNLAGKRLNYLMKSVFYCFLFNTLNDFY